MHSDPKTFDALLDKLTTTTSTYLRAQVEAGAQVVQVFDSWVGLLGPGQFRERIAHHLERLFDELRGVGVPVIYFAFGGATLLPEVRALRPDVAGIDWRVPLASARRELGPDIALQGNLDPAVLLGPADIIERRAREVCDELAGAPGHIFNLGHGIWKETRPEAVATLVDAVHAWQP
jgi:uroporphyrinogen decarboxylase